MSPLIWKSTDRCWPGTSSYGKRAIKSKAPPMPRRASRTGQSNSKIVNLAGGRFSCVCFGCRTQGSGRNFQAILVHIEALFPVQALDELAGRLRDGSGKARRIRFYLRFHGLFVAMSLWKVHLRS